MVAKLDRGVLPKGHTAEDFECFGPPATQDGVFTGTMLADMGCFTQDGKDSNKFYHGAVVKSKKTGSWFAYFEWGRTGSAKGDFNFVECDSQAQAQAEYEKQLHSKNDKRGEWSTLAGRKVLQAKAGKDCYLVRPLATRSTGLPDARRIVFNDGAKKTASVVKTDSVNLPTRKWDDHTLRLMKDMNVATVSYAKNAVQGGNIPTQASLDEGRDILIEAKKRLVKVGDSEKAQKNDSELKNLTNMLYSRIPKRKAVGDDNWILNQTNIDGWDKEIDVFESALYAIDTGSSQESDPLAGFNIEMAWLDPNSERGKFLKNWMPSASRNKHGDMRGGMKIANMWDVTQLGHIPSWKKTLAKIAGEKIRTKEVPLHQPRSRDDLENSEKNDYRDANVGMLFHGTRSVNVPGILREGLRLPKQLVGVVITGAMFGGGIYWADDWKKSAGYTSGYSRWGGGDGSVRGRKAFMFVSDVALGNPHVAPGPRGYTEPPRGHHCVFGAHDRSGVANNEWIIFNGGQHRMRYLVEFET